MTVQAQAPNQAPKSSRDYINWREMYAGPDQSQANLDFWDMLRGRSAQAQSIIGEMPFVFQPNSVPPMGPQGLVDPAKGPPTRSDVQQYIRPGSDFPTSSGFPTFTRGGARGARARARAGGGGGGGGGGADADRLARGPCRG